MLVLAMESSAKPASVAVCKNSKLLGQYFQNSGLTHSITLMAMTESILRNLDIKIADIDLVAVSNGPGSFTGIRIGVSAAKGLAWGADKPICGVSTLEAMAYQTPMENVILCPVMDARRSQVYNALFKWENNNLIRIKKDRVITLCDLSSELHNTNDNYLLIGDGAEMSYDYLSAAGIFVSFAPTLLRYQTAYGVGLAAIEKVPMDAIELEPTYLRPSQAERNLIEN